MPVRGRPRTFDRQQALQRAVEVFLARGYDGATLEELQAAMGGIAAPSFYAAFGSKDDLFREAVELYAATVGDRPRQALSRAKVRDAVEGMLREAAAMFSDPRGAGGCMVILAALNSTRANKDAYDLLHHMRQQLPTVIQQRLEQGIAEGELPAAIDAAGVASFYTTVLHGLAVRARDGASRTALDAAVDGAMAAWRSLTTAPAAPRQTPRPRSRRR
jgi:AcrR family transcriptional regulator